MTVMMMMMVMKKKKLMTSILLDRDQSRKRGDHRLAGGRVVWTLPTVRHGHPPGETGSGIPPCSTGGKVRRVVA